MSDLKGKNILFIGPKTFGYEKEITKCLTRMGAYVDYYDDRPFDSTIKKVMLRVCPLLVRQEVNQYFSGILNSANSKQYDYVFCIKLECFPLHLLKELKNKQSNATFLFYAWDSFKNNPNAIECLSLFDRTFTFDDKDGCNYGLAHRPLFYLDIYKEISCLNNEYDVVFIGSVHMHRYQFIKAFMKHMSSDVNAYIYMYVPSKLLYWARKFLLFPVYGGSKESDFKFEPLSQADIVDVLARSNVVLDFALPSQDGLTMRSIEAFGANKKLITNNETILKYDFFDKGNILVVDELITDIPDTFLKTPYIQSSKDVYERYSINGWVKEIFELG